MTLRRFLTLVTVVAMVILGLDVALTGIIAIASPGIYSGGHRYVAGGLFIASAVFTFMHLVTVFKLQDDMRVFRLSNSFFVILIMGLTLGASTADNPLHQNVFAVWFNYDIIIPLYLEIVIIFGLLGTLSFLKIGPHSDNQV